MANVVSKDTCDWCCGSSALNVFPGVFRDFDSDLGDGIPVCGGCGGTGWNVMSEDFQVRVKRITELRFAYCPTDKSPPPVSERLRILRELIVAIKEIHRDFGDNRPCFSQRVVDGSLDKRIVRLEENVAQAEELVNKIRVATMDSAVPDPEQNREALIPIIRGDVTGAEAVLRKLIEEHPNNSIAHHDLGILLVQYKDDPNAARPFFEKACQLEPKRASYFVHAGRLLTTLQQPAKADAYFRGAADCSDFDTLDAEDCNLVLAASTTPPAANA